MERKLPASQQKAGSALTFKIHISEVLHSAVDKDVGLARLVATEGFSDMTTEEVNTLIKCHSNPLSYEELVEITRSVSEEEEEVADDTTPHHDFPAINHLHLLHFHRAAQVFHWHLFTLIDIIHTQNMYVY